MNETWLLAIDTATSVVVVAAGSPSGALLEVRAFPAEHRHGSLLVPTIQGLAHDRGLELGALAGIVVGTGPGAFTGLRVGLATAKVLAHELAVPLVGVATAEALLAADPSARLVLLPAGPHDRTVVERGRAPRLDTGAWTAIDAAANDAPATDAPGAGAGDGETDGPWEPADAIAVDLPGRATPVALERGRLAVAELPARLLALGAARLRAGDADDPARLVPVYVTLPRGAMSEVGDGGVAWSRDPR